MINVNEVNYNEITKIISEANIIRNNKGERYYNISSSFDIETTSILYNDVKVGFMYIWMFQIEDYQIYGRTWIEFNNFMKRLKSIAKTGKNKIYTIYVHNLSYEFQFIKDLFEWENVFAISERKPIKATTIDGFMFKDSYILSGLSLEKTAENLVNHKIEKQVGSLDYSKVRTDKTKLSDRELSYCESDIRIVVYYIREQIKEYGDITKIPLTNTGRVRTFVRNKCYFTNTNHRKSSGKKYANFSKLIKSLTLTYSEYVILKQCFMGGFTHANANKEGLLLENVGSFDFTSSYPTVMIAEKFPMSKPIHEYNITIEEIKKDSNYKAFVFEVTFKNISPIISQEHYISESKCLKLVNPIIDNGRVVSADLLTMMITEIDFKIIEMAYEWNSESIVGCISFIKGYLPKPIIESILELYGDKTTLKGVKGKEQEYLKSKGMINSIYGMTVTDIIQELNTYDNSNGWFKKPLDTEKEMKKYNDSKKRFLYYAWGIYVTAYARQNLWTGIIECGEDYNYSDTDSVKISNFEDHQEYFSKYNNWIMRKLEATLNYYDLDINLLKPKTIKGVEKPLGVWDFEGVYSHFKTLGAKRYLVEQDNELELTCAGLSKKNGLEYMKSKCNSNLEVFDMFDNELYIPEDNTGKMTHTYIDEHYKIKVKDYQGNESIINTYSGVHLENCSFTLSISKKYEEFLKSLADGYVYKGITKQL